MAQKRWKYTGTEERVFLFPRSFTVAPGEVVLDDSNPDPTFFVPADSQAKEES